MWTKGLLRLVWFLSSENIDANMARSRLEDNRRVSFSMNAVFQSYLCETVSEDLYNNVVVNLQSESMGLGRWGTYLLIC